MEHLLVLREKYGSVYGTELPDGLVIPWKPLSIGDFIEYDKEFRRGAFPQAYLENEIFKKCVLDEYIVDNIQSRKAGDITTVVTGIMLASGPSSIQEMQNLLMLKRLEASGVIHQIVNTITRAYQGYTPEQLYNMDYQSLMLRFAQAENKLLEIGLISEPMTLESNQQQTEDVSAGTSDTSQLFEKYYEQRGTTPPKSKPDKTVISASEMASGAALGQDIEDKEMLQQKMINEIKDIYPDYIDQMSSGKKLSIKTVEERQEDARVRIKENRDKVSISMEAQNKKLAEKQAKDKEYEAKVAKMIEARARRKRRR